MGSDKIIHWLSRYSFLQSFIVSKYPKGLLFYISIQSSVCKLKCLFDITKCRRKVYLSGQWIILSYPIFSIQIKLGLYLGCVFTKKTFCQYLLFVRIKLAPISPLHRRIQVLFNLQNKENIGKRQMY